MSTNKTLSASLRTSSETIRGTEYAFRELTAREYDDIIKLASGEDESADLATVLRLMTLRSVTPAIAEAELMELPYPVYNRLLQKVNRMHFSPDEEGETPPNASAPTSSSTSS